LTKRPTTKKVESYRFAEKVKKFPWCPKYKKITEEKNTGKKEEKNIQKVKNEKT